ncbi:cation diffusion facilitator family transporter [Mesobacillus jeotgali]|uniref:Cation diffusion facilitator family transporter n=1 Tax=Mesobacillus jeotgali TaxID=129985 RepID=A0ABY9VG79_9BACI|nr:cation diffusion facilitator family transporter [Mesobacillus jeotgali]UYZ21576.1 cation diffusion facilitator family transporter [Mesobacillus jeotgali]WNF22583.1 cation diffusion facilitator family transporter [Mesobacillus jeotgali]
MGKNKHKSMGVAFFLNLSFTIIEIIGGILTGSIAIISDAIHDLGDSISLGMSWYLERKASRKPSDKYTFGYKRLSLMGSLLNAAVLIFGSLYVLIEAGKRLFEPVSPNSQGMFWLAILGIAVNGYAAYRIKKGESGMNQKMLSWHLLEDLLGWIAVLVVSIIMQFKEIPILDPLLSIGITLFVLYHVIKNLKKTLVILMDAVPQEVNLKDMKDQFLNLEYVMDIHNLHYWSLDGKSSAFSTHLIVQEKLENGQEEVIRNKIRQILKNNDEGIDFISIQVERGRKTC